MRLFRPLIGMGVAAGVLGGGLALGLGLASAATASSATATRTARAATETAATRTARPATVARAGAPAAAPAGTSTKKGKCTHMSGGSHPFPGRGGPASIPAASS